MYRVPKIFSCRGASALMIAAMFACHPAVFAVAQEESVRLPGMVVSASQVPLEAEEVGSAVTVITAEEIERKQVRIVSDLLGKSLGSRSIVRGQSAP